MRWAERGISPVKASLIGILLFAIGAYFIFTKALPFTSHYTVTAVVHNSNLLEPGSPVRIGGVTVGKVTATGRYKSSDLATVTMQIDNTSQEIHSDATIAIRPRLFLEGNFYVQLSPGTPSAPALPKRRHDPGRAHGGPGPDRPAARRVAVSDPPPAPADAARVRGSGRRAADGRRGPESRPVGTRADRRRGAEQDLRYERCLAPRLGDRFRSAHRATRRSALARGLRARARERGSRPRRRPADLVHLGLRPHAADDRRPAAGPAPDGPAARPDGHQRQHRVRLARSGVPRDRAVLE